VADNDEYRGPPYWHLNFTILGCHSHGRNCVLVNESHSEAKDAFFSVLPVLSHSKATRKVVDEVSIYLWPVTSDNMVVKEC
jgi:hypothetical protein